MTVSYPMYSWPATAAAEQRLWARIRAHLPATSPLPESMIDPAKLWDHWLSPDLILSQTCGLPFRTRLRDHVSLILTPDYRLPDCPPGYYASVFVMAEDRADPNPAHWHRLRLAVNSFASQSGWAAPQNHMISNGYTPFSMFLKTGAHIASARAVAEGRADIACLDVQSWRLIQRYAPLPLRSLAQTEPTPGLPFITAKFRDPVPFRRALIHAFDTMSDEDRALLNLYDLVDIPAEVYDSIPNPPIPPANAVKAA